MDVPENTTLIQAEAGLPMMAIVMDDADAEYPVSMDPTFSDVNWTTLGSGLGGVSYSNVLALAVSGSDAYAGGNFTTAGGNAANYIAKWNGSSWSALGSGMNSNVYALAVLGSDLYAGGYFTMAG